MADAFLELDDDDDDALFGGTVRPPLPNGPDGAARIQQPKPPSQQPKPLSYQPTPSQGGPRIPGPAGALGAAVMAADPNNEAGPAAFSQYHAPGRYASGFRRTPAWLKLDEHMRDEGAPAGRMQVAGRMGLGPLQAAASEPPPVPLRPPLLCVLIKSIDAGDGPLEPAACVLADETGEFGATLHPGLFTEHAGAVVPGAAVAMKRAPVLTLAPHDHHLIVHPDSVLYMVPPVPAAPVREAAARPEAAAARPGAAAADRGHLNEKRKMMFKLCYFLSSC